MNIDCSDCADCSDCSWLEGMKLCKYNYQCKDLYEYLSIKIEDLYFINW